MSELDPAILYRNLRATTAQLLRLPGDPAALTPLQSLQASVAGVLLLEVDTLEGAALAGHPVDVARLGTVVGLIAKLLSERSGETTTLRPGPGPEDAESARAKLGQLLDGMVRAREFKERSEVDELRAEVERLKADNARLSAVPPVAAVSNAVNAPVAPPKPPSEPLRPPVPRPRGRPEGFSDGTEPWRRSYGSSGMGGWRRFDPPPGW